MPYVNVQITQGATRQQKADIVADISESLIKHLNKRPEHIYVVIQEIEQDNWGFAGKLTSEWLKKD
jgi:4-oxalocrotonate tautomerase